MANQRSLEEFAPFISGDDAPLLVGGQAVNLWCLLAPELSPDVEVELQKYRPFTSKDFDVVGDRALLNRLAKSTHLKKRDFGFQPSPCLGYLYDDADPETPVLEVLRSVHGLAPAEILQGQPVNWDQWKFKTLTPFRLLKAKIANADDLDQKIRQDVRHVRMLIPCVRAYLAYSHFVACDRGTPGDLKFLKQALTYTLKVIKSAAAERVSKRHRIALQRCFDRTLLRKSPLEAARNFYLYQLK